jgi:flagellar biosynthetic protein FliQ
MYTDDAIDLVRETLMLALMLGGPIIAAGLVVGIIVAVFQAATTVQDQTFSLVPKLLVMFGVALLTLPWLATRLVDFAQRMFSGG